MKILVLDKKSIIVLWMFLAILVFFLPLAYVKTNPILTVSKEVPIYSVEKTEKIISITFDTAWDNGDINDVIKVLNDYDCKSTFFLTGDFIDKYPASVKTLFDSGHEIANHSNTHAHFNNLTREKMILDIEKCDEKIKNITGQKDVIFRAPYGEYNDLLVKACKDTNRYIVQWDVDSLDYMGLDSVAMKKRIMDKVKNGSIILFHTGTKNTASALPEILSTLKNDGYKFSIVSNLIIKDNYYIDHAGKQKNSN